MTVEPAPEAARAWCAARPEVGGGVRVPEAWRREAAAFRGELGLATDRPVVMSGHQPGFWHAGILAKVLAVEAACERSGASPAWVVVDHDPESPAGLRYPTAVWGEGVVEFAGADAKGMAPSVVASARSAVAGAKDAAAVIEERVRAVMEAMRAHAGEANFERQMTLSSADLLDAAGLPGGVLRSAFCASAIGKTALFGRMVEEWGDVASAVAAVKAYNAAAKAFPEAGIRALMVTETDAELPVWRVDAMGARQRVMASKLGGVGKGDLVPRALCMTMLLRLAGCDVFVHGLGGGNYDRVMEAWVAAWMPGAELAPSAVVTATMMLEVPGVEAPVEKKEADKAAWRVQAARHTPAMLGDEGAAREKAVLVREIRALKGKRLERKAAYLKLQRMLMEMRTAHAAEIERLERVAAELRVKSAGDAMASDRTWPWMLHSAERLGMLRDAVRNVFAHNDKPGP